MLVAGKLNRFHSEISFLAKAPAIGWQKRFENLQPVGLRQLAPELVLAGMGEKTRLLLGVVILAINLFEHGGVRQRQGMLEAATLAFDDVVLFACKPSGAMLLNEAAGRAGVQSGAPALGRPTCMALPASLQHGVILSLGCMGNRVYTGLGEYEMYFVVRGKDLAAVAEALVTITSANAALNQYATGRRAELATI